MQLQYLNVLVRGLSVAILLALPLGAANAAEFRVPADYPTIQAAVNAAAAVTTEAAWVKVLKGHYRERVRLHDLPASEERLTITGGFEPTYDHVANPISGESVLTGSGAGPVFEVKGDSKREVYISEFTIAGGKAPACEDGPDAAGLLVEVSGPKLLRFDYMFVKDHRLSSRDGDGAVVQMRLRGDASVWFRKSVISGNHLVGPGATAAGMRAVLRGTSSLSLHRNQFLDNRVRSTDRRQAAQAAGAHFRVLDNARLGMGINRFARNVASGAGPARYAALMIAAEDAANVVLGGETKNDDDGFIDNRTESDTGDASGTAMFSVGSSIRRPGAGRPTLSAERLFFSRNVVGNRGHVLGVSSRSGDVRVRDTLIFGSSADGLHAVADWGGQNTFTNLTIANNAGRAVRVPHSSTGSITYLSNSILSGNGTDIPVGSPVQTANLVGVDPLFVNAAAGDFHLQPGSLAIDAGNDTPPGGLSAEDLDEATRRQGAAVDIGTFEHTP